MIFKLLTISSLCLLAIAYPSGAPEGSCDLRIPGHMVEPQTSPAPFKVEAVSLGGGKYKITIKSTDSNDFKGFLLAVVDSAGKYIGNFGSSTNSKTLTCPKGNALTHIDNVGKKKVEIEWTKPASATGSIDLMATIVRDYSTFWTNAKTTITLA
ncbi:putative defense protein 3 [Tetranychus urticae]|uniref:Reelin domain-containing protein n=1 Tax=Tetranychus urticae TaxID=32264 RepID=T1JWS6_TETUR|nr:putative defense protein 3 [Tetranychus urticae]